MDQRMQASTAGGYVDFSRFGAMRSQAQTDAPGAMAAIADEFEALFVDLMLKAARKAEIEGGLFDSNALSTYREMFNHQIAITMAKDNDLGIGRMMIQQFGGMLGAESDGPSPLTVLPLKGETTPADEEFLPERADRPTRTWADVDPRAIFKRDLSAPAERTGQTLGVAPHALLAQAALETGWGKHVIRNPDGSSSHNYFGIKADARWAGGVVSVPTTEYVAGRAVTVTAKFRAYDTVAAAFDDYAKFISGNPRYRDVVAAGANDAEFAHGLAAAGYATDPHYAAKILAIIDAGDWGESVQAMSRRAENSDGK